MSTEIAESNPESNPVVETSIVEEKSSSLLQAARMSFDEGDYSASINSLEDIPATLRNDEMKELLDRAKRLRTAETQFQAAKRAFEAKDYDQTLLTIKKIPEADRSNECIALEKKARMIPLMKWSREKLNNYRYDEVIERLKLVPEGERSDDLIEILQKAYTSKRRIEELNREIESALCEADKQCSAEKYGEAMTLLEELLMLNPANDEVEDKLHEISALKKRFLERDRLFHEATTAFDEKEYASCENLLKKIPERIRKGDVLELLESAVKSRRRCKILSDEIVTAIKESNYSSLETYFSELGELQNNPYSKISGLLEEELLFRTILEMAKLSCLNSNVSEVLHGFLDSLVSSQVIGFLQSTNGSLSKYFTQDCKILIPKIQTILQELPQYSPERNRETLKTIGSISEHLGQVKTHWDQWHRFWVLLDQTLEFGREEWSTKNRWFESEKTNALDLTTRELAELAEQLLSTSQKDSWTLLKTLVGGDLNFSSKPVARAFHKIKLYLDSRNWNSSPLVPLSRKRIIRGTLFAIGVAALASVVQVLMTFVFGIGGFLGFGMVFFLAGLWTAFYLALHKIM